MLKFLITLSAIVASFFNFLSAQETVAYTGSYNPLAIGKKAAIFYDTSGNLTADNVKNISGFISVNNEIPVIQVKKGNIWIKVAVLNLSKDSTFYLNLPYFNVSNITIYKIDGKKIEKKFEGGNSIKSDNIIRSISNYILPCNLNPKDTGVYLFKIASLHPLLFPLLFQNEKSLEDSLNLQNTIISIFFGIIIGIFFYNLFLFISTSDRIYLIYIAYLLFLGLAQMCLNGYAFNFIWPNHPILNQYSLTVTSCAAGILAIIFAIYFLQVKKYSPRLYPVLYFFIGVYVIGIIFSLAGNNYITYQILNFTSLIAGLTLITAAINVSRHGYKPAVFYLVAWLTFLLGMVVFVLRNLNILPYNNITTYILYGGTAIEVILLSIALADKINILKKEKEAMQADALRVSQENEQLVKEQNILLERKVAERTEELQTANIQLSDAFKNLKGAQIQLVEAEKMASLGQLTAGIAHEINNPINFVKSNIKPLQLDFKDLIEVINEYDKLHDIDNKDLEKHLKKIDSLKKDMDLDFVKDEIANLMKGIENGAERTAEIVRGLRTFSRLDESVIKTVDIHEGIDSTLVLLRSSIPDNVTIVKDYTQDGEIECFPGKLNQVFMNIISNGIQAIKEKEKMCDHEQITISTKNTGNEMEIRIKDTGKGMSNEVKQKIFDPFFTTKDVGEGTGLGLAIVFKIIQEHSGKIQVHSEEGKGSEFVLTLHSLIPGKPII